MKSFFEKNNIILFVNHEPDLRLLYFTTLVMRFLECSDLFLGNYHGRIWGLVCVCVCPLLCMYCLEDESREHYNQPNILIVVS